MAMCRRCIAPTTALNVVLDPDGICNLCHAYDRQNDGLTGYDYMKPLLQQRFAQSKGKYPYDALVGLSGGKDSSYVAFRLVRDYGLRLLLFTYDNGYLTDSARNNITHMVKKLTQDHIFVGPGAELQSAIARASMRRFGIPCIGCTFPGFLAAIKVAADRQIPYIIHGRSPAQMFKELAPGAVDPFLPFLQSNLLPPDQQANRQFISTMAQKLVKHFKWFISNELQSKPHLETEIKSLYFSHPERFKPLKNAPEFIGYYLFEPYDEHKIKKELNHELQWKKASDDRFMSHDDCSVHAAAVYLYTKSYGHPILQPELGTMVRLGQLSRDEALLRLKLEVESTTCDNNSLQSLADVTELSTSELVKCAGRSHKRLAILRWGLHWRNKLFGHLLKMPISNTKK